MDSEALVKLVTMKMPFGKHAGRALADLPGNYLAWFAREGFPQGELGQLLELMHTLDHNGLRGLLAPIQRAHGIAPVLGGINLFGTYYRYHSITFVAYLR